MNATVAAAFTLLACATPQVPVAGGEGPERNGPYSVELVDDHGRALPMFRHRGGPYVLGALGERYLVRVRNDSGRRVEVVVSVDGRDVIDGRTAGWHKRGYLVEPWAQVTIDGYRTSERSVAAFRFARVRDSYAARMGNARDVGVIGVAVFPEAERLARTPAPYEPQVEAGPPAAGDESASAAPEVSREGARRAQRRGLGTEFGEEHRSHVREVPFERSRARPDAVMVLRYDDRSGLLALGIDVDRRCCTDDDAWLRESATPFRGNAFAEPPPGWSSR